MKLKKFLGAVTLALCLITMTSASYDKPTKPSELSAPIVTALDGLLDKIYSQQSSFSTTSDYLSYLDNLSNKLSALRDTFKTTSAKYILVNYIVSGVNNIEKSVDEGDLEKIVKTINDLTTTPINTNTGTTKPTTTTNSGTTTPKTVNECKYDECLNNGFYVISSENPSYPNGCNTSGLTTPDNLCILKINNMYVAPKNFTMITDSKGVNTLINDVRTQIAPNVVKYNPIDLQTPCKEQLDALDSKYGRYTTSWDPNKYNEFYRERQNVRDNSPACKALDAGDKTLENIKSQGKVNIPITPNTCSDAFKSILNDDSFKWNFIDTMGGDTKKHICDNNTSNKSGLCAVDLNRSKLRLHTDKPYAIGVKDLYELSTMLSLDPMGKTYYYEKGVENFRATYIGDWGLLKPEPIRRESYSYYVGVSFPEGKDGTYNLCVAYK